VSGRCARWLAAGIAAALTSQALAAGQFIEDIRISRVDDEATIVIDLACPMRFQSDMATSGGIALEIRVVPLEACRQIGLGTGFASERTRPVGGQLAHLVEVEYESLGPTETIMMLQFDRAVSYEVAQRGGLRSLELTVHLDASAAQPEAMPRPPAATVPTPAAPPRAIPRGTPEREPMHLRVREPQTTADYVINLQSTREPTDLGVVRDVAVSADRQLYVSQTEVGGEVWYRLRVGFFTSEEDARATLEQLRGQFPRAWIGRAEPQEVSSAGEYALARGEFYVESAGTPEEPVVAAAAAGTPSPGESLSSERIAALMAEAREAIVAQDFDTAIRNYTRVLQQPGEHRAEAREYLGVAREKNGQIAHARAEYRAYLEEFDSEPDVRRVTQRLNGLVTVAAAPRAPLRSEQGRGQSRWDMGSGVSQYFRHNLNQFDEDQEEIVTFSALVSDIDFSLRRSGDAVDVVGRVALSHFMDFMDESRSSNTADPTRVSYAYLDVDSVDGKWAVRSGRQSLHNWGVLGRFDGLHFTYDWSDGRRLHYQMGYPVESTRYSVRTDRQFQGVAVEFDDLIGRWDIGTYVNQQTIESVNDRQAAGIEARYMDDRRSVTGMLDYDTHFGELNMIFLLGTWRFDNQLTLSALYDVRESPFLTTRNALIGQPVSTIDELLIVWSVEEIEQLALDRTAHSVTTTLGISKPVGDRFQINADLTATEIDATIASGGVAAIPGTGQQLYLTTTFIGSGLFGTGDVMILNLRSGTAETYETSQITLDARFPVGRRLRLNPRIRYATWQSLQGGGTRDTVGAAFRLLLNLRNHYRLELEVGRDEIERVNTSSTQISTGRFFNVGYRASF
jgi:SPOR domain